jgi:hypothetical protein
MKNEHFIKVLIKLQEEHEIYIINLVVKYRFVTILLAYESASLFRGILDLKSIKPTPEWLSYSITGIIGQAIRIKKHRLARLTNNYISIFCRQEQLDLKQNQINWYIS